VKGLYGGPTTAGLRTVAPEFLEGAKLPPAGPARDHHGAQRIRAAARFMEQTGRAPKKPREENEDAVNCENVTRPPVHPGVFFERNILPEFLRQRRTVTDIARLLGVSRQTLHRVMAGQSSITPDMAVWLGKLCGNGPDLWLNLQARYAGWEATQRLSKQIKHIPTLGDQ
jgi:antitoxin HigA-1